MENDKIFLLKTFEIASDGIRNGGGPFGAVIVKDGKIISEAFNRVVLNNDPTAHAEILSIREASFVLKTHDLKECTLYTSCEPCPMCLGAVYWAHLDKMYYGNSKTDAKNIGFDDSFIYDEIDLRPENRRVKTTQLLPDEAIVAFQAWTLATDKVEY